MDREASTWFREPITDHLYQACRITGIAFSGQSEFQTIEVMDTLEFGRILVLDGKTQSAESDEFIYHEILVHPAMIIHPAPRRVFIAGGGEGATLREVLSHSTVEEAVMVDIDREVVEVSRRYLPSWHLGSFDDPRTTLLHQDAGAYLKDAEAPFDVIIIDLSDPVKGNPSALLYTREFYQLALERLTPQGVLAIQAECADYGRTQAFTAICNTLGQVFPQVYPYHLSVPSFSGDWGFALATLGPDPTLVSPKEVDQAISTRITRPLRAYDGVTHQGIFTFSRAVREVLEAETRVLTENDLLVVT
ncbi:MAG: polyamine aminopropyltransferase [Chloroflexi bacterium]|nr:polyamine aminopropyltransferase [Chloroflexota bacterium]